MALSSNTAVFAFSKALDNIVFLSFSLALPGLLSAGLTSYLDMEPFWRDDVRGGSCCGDLS
jgi:hypothetical protein